MANPNYLLNKTGLEVDNILSSAESHVATNNIHVTQEEKTKLAGIAANANNYTHPTTSGNKHIPSGGSSGQILRWSADGTAAWGSDNNTDTKVTSVGNHYTPSGGTTTSASGGTLTDITNSSSGVQVLTGVTKDAAGHITGVTSVALKSVNTNTTYGVATSSALGLIKSGTDITVDSSGNVSVNDDSHNHVISNVDGLQSALDGKLSKTAYEYNKELALGSSGKVCIGVFPCYDSNISVEIKSTTNTTYNGTLVIATQNINTSLGGVYTATVYGDEKNTLTPAIKIQYLSGSNAFSVYINLPSWSKNLLHIQCVSLAGTPSNIATMVDAIPSTATIVPTNAFNHTHNYAGSLSAGGSATSAVKLDSSAGSATQPIYFKDGKPTATTYTLGKSVPSDAKFTDTTYSAATTSANGLMSSTDKKKLDGIAEGANKTVVDSALSSTSTNPVQNKVVNTAISNLNTLVGNTAVATQISTAIASKADLDTNGKVPSSQLPSYVDDVIEYNGKSNFPSTGESGKIYVDTATNLTYRWSGSAYVEISPSLALGETSSTAYRGDRGKTAYDHSQSTHARTDATKTAKSSTNGNILINGTETTVYTHPSGTNPHGTTKSDVGLGNVGNFKAVSTVASQGLTDTEKSNARANIGAGTSSFSGNYNDLTNKPTIPTVGNGTITIKQAGTSKGTFTMNQSGNTTIELTDNNTDTKVTAVGNHYTPSGGTTTSASGGTLTDITNSSSGVQVVTGVTKDAAGHVTGVTSLALKSVNTVYTHPSTHPATMITEDSTHRFVTDTEKTTWNNKASKSTITTATLLASNWDSTAKTYSFESDYPSVNYDIEVEIDGDNCTDEQLEAWIAAKPLSSLKNKINAKGEVPSVDIPIIITTISTGKNIPIVSWTDGTDAEIAAMVEAADAGDINLADYWSVGDTRTVHLFAMEATGVGESHAEQDVELVLMHAGGYELADGSKCNFVVGQKDSLAEKGYMNSTDTNSGSWDSTKRRAWCNNVYKNAIPSTLQPIFKQFKTITAETYNGTTLKTSLDYFALPAAKEIFGGDTASSTGSATGWSNLTEFNALFQFDWYKTADSHIKKPGISGSASDWWERSPYYNGSYSFCAVDKGGGALDGPADFPCGLAPFGCI